MDHSRKYPPQEVDFSKIPVIREAFLKPFNKVNIIMEYYYCGYQNKQSTYNSVADFVRFLGIRQPHDLHISISVNYGKDISYDSSKLVLQFSRYSVEQTVDGMEETAALELCDLIERELGLEETQRIIEAPIPERTAFIAHSFDNIGEETAKTVGQLLRLLDFKVVTGKSYSSKKISEKVKARVREQGIVICIHTKESETTEGDFLPATWVIQEAAFSEGLDKPLFLFLEEGIKKDLGIHGDIEYIPFSAGNLTEPLLKLIEGLKELSYEFSD